MQNQQHSKRGRLSILSLGFRTITVCVLSLTAFFLIDPIVPSGEPDLQVSGEHGEQADPSSPLPMSDSGTTAITDALLVSIAAGGLSFGFGLAYDKNDHAAQLTTA